MVSESIDFVTIVSTLNQNHDLNQLTHSPNNLGHTLQNLNFNRMQDLRPILRLPIELRLKIATHVARPVNITEALQSCCTQDYFRSLSNDHSALFKVSGFVGLKSRYRKAFKSTNPVVFVRRQDLIGPRYVRMKWRMLRHPLIQLTGPQLVMTAYGIGPRIDSQISPLLDGKFFSVLSIFISVRLTFIHRDDDTTSYCCRYWPAAFFGHLAQDRDTTVTVI